MARQYSVTCPCGRTHAVTGGDAGSQVPCGCGRPVEVSDLRTLRAAAGEPTTSPELVIEAVLQDGHVPGGEECVCCGVPTDAVCHVRVECERAESKAGGWRINPIAFLAGMFLAEATESIDRGRSVRYRLPVRMCARCGRGLARSGVPAALRKVEVYGQLLDKYPHASVGRPEC